MEGTTAVVDVEAITLTGDPTTSHGLEFANYAGNPITGPDYAPHSTAPPPPQVAATMVAAAGSATRALWGNQSVPGVPADDLPYRGPTGEQLHPHCVEFTANQERHLPPRRGR